MNFERLLQTDNSNPLFVADFLRFAAPPIASFTILIYAILGYSNISGTQSNVPAASITGSGTGTPSLETTSFDSGCFGSNDIDTQIENLKNSINNAIYSINSASNGEEFETLQDELEIASTKKQLIELGVPCNISIALVSVNEFWRLVPFIGQSTSLSEALEDITNVFRGLFVPTLAFLALMVFLFHEVIKFSGIGFRFALDNWTPFKLEFDRARYAKLFWRHDELQTLGSPIEAELNRLAFKSANAREYEGTRGVRERLESRAVFWEQVYEHTLGIMIWFMIITASSIFSFSYLTFSFAHFFLYSIFVSFFVSFSFFNYIKNSILILSYDRAFLNEIHDLSFEVSTNPVWAYLSDSIRQLEFKVKF